jgi:cytidylate kinase
MKLFGIGGTNGAGKDTVGHFLAEEHNYLFVSVTELLRDEAKARGWPVDREALRTISAEWRRESGLGVLVDKAVAFYEAQDKNYGGLAIASLRNPGEADSVHQYGGKVIWVDADAKLRYERIQANAATRGRAEEDNRTFEQFLADEEAEMHASGDAATLDMAGVKAKADLVLFNETDKIEDFYNLAEKSLGDWL